MNNKTCSVVLCCFHLVELTECGEVFQGLFGGQVGKVLCCQLLEWLGLSVEPVLCKNTHLYIKHRFLRKQYIFILSNAVPYLLEDKVREVL